MVSTKEMYKLQLLGGWKCHPRYLKISLKNRHQLHVAKLPCTKGKTLWISLRLIISSNALASLNIKMRREWRSDYGFSYKSLFLL